MTIITKPSSTKKEDKAVPLVAPSVSPSILESGSNVVLVRRATGHPARQASILLLFLIALLVMCIGIIGGVMIYRQYAMGRINRMRWHGTCNIPMETDNMNDRAMFFANQGFSSSEDDDSWMQMFKPIFDELSRVQNDLEDDAKEFQAKIMKEFNSEPKDSDSSSIADVLNNTFLKEEFELNDEDEESYAKINVPNFTETRSATFLHDFKTNQTGIIDKDAKRCFFMPLDTETVLPPRDMRDLIRKLYSGYYNIDTTVLRKTMRVKLPEVTDMSRVSPRVVNECKNMKIYELEKIVSGVFKRSIDAAAHPVTYTQFAGKGFDSYHLTNLNELDQYEKA
ncbi:uncharacterized protein LOC134832496 [Culicoides brevitarsis]|uniref:uncharacterized protein LOC134832496 n=1 Tax=Culicoides brevitarsis TaxID=469753 RepID=UPI00307B2BC6